MRHLTPAPGNISSRLPVIFHVRSSFRIIRLLLPVELHARRDSVIFARENVVLAQRKSFPVVCAQNPPQVRMPSKTMPNMSYASRSCQSAAGHRSRDARHMRIVRAGKTPSPRSCGPGRSSTGHTRRTSCHPRHNPRRKGSAASRASVDGSRSRNSATAHKSVASTCTRGCLSSGNDARIFEPNFCWSSVAI